MLFQVIKGTFHVKGYQPDGDSIRFRAKNPANWKTVDFKKAKRGANPMVQLRLEGIDALEIHYNGYHQPRTFAIGALEQLLGMLGITGLRYSMSVRTIIQANDGVEGYIAVAEVDAFGRPVCLVFPADVPLMDGSFVSSQELPVRRSVNYLMTLRGLVYPTFYASTDRFLANEIADATRTAREAQRGIWVIDRSSDFSLWDVRTMYEDVLILPKLFRRLTTYCEQYEDLSQLATWLKAEKDVVLLADGTRTTLSSVVSVSGKTLSMTELPENLFFEPKT